MASHFELETGRRLIKIEERLEDLQEFKIEMLWGSKITAMIVSAVCGFCSMIASGVITYLITTKIPR